MDAIPPEPAFFPGELKPGQILDDRFEIVEMVNRGGMACIYKAEDLARSRLVALKVPLLKYESDPVMFSRFQREEAIARRLDHPYILKVLPAGWARSRPYLVMEFLEGQTLSRLIAADRPLPEAEAAGIASRICEALECMRENGVVHRDLKPENIFACRDGSIRILDFGIAKVSQLRRLTLVGLTATLGTPDYMAPEQVGGKRGDHRTDIYSLGAILYEMTVGKVPFEGDSPYVVMNVRTTGDPIAPRQVNERLSPQIEEIILHAMERAPSERYATAAQLKAELDRYASVRLTGRNLRLQPVRALEGEEGPWIRRGLFIALVVVILQLLGFGLLFWHFAGHSRP